MNKHAQIRVMTASALVALAGLGLSASAQDTQPTGPTGRRPVEGEPTPLAFKQVTVEKLIDFIVQATGKVVIPQQDVMSRKITVLNDRPIPREQALDLVFQALAQNGVGVVENEHVITLRAIEEVSKHDVPVIPPSESVLNRRDSGTLVQKVFALRNSTAKALGDVIKDAVPDYAKLNIDEESNQVAIIGPISLQQRMERLITSLDRPSSAALQTETFRLRYADAEAVKANIEELFQGGSGGSGGNNRRSGQNNQNNQGPGGLFRFAGVSGGGGEGGTSASTEVRVTANAQQNAVTVVADPTILDQIRVQIQEFWDKQLPEEAVVPKVYDLKNSDPIKIRDALEGMFGRANPQAGRTNQGGGQQGGNTQSTSTSQGVGRLAGQFSFQAVPDAGRLIVVAKSQDNLAVIDKIIADLDQPQTVGLPSVVELKHASAEDLSEQLNALLAQDGTLASVRRSEQGLSASSSNVSPFSQSAVDQSTSTTTTTGEDGSTAETIAFWWQRSRTPTDRRASSNLVGQLRIVPIWRQNALLVTAPPEYKQSVLDMIEMLDKPGRQVLIAAMVVEVSATDSLQLGLRWSSQTLNPSNADNSVSIGNSASGTRNNWATSLFDTSVLNSSVNLNLLLQALSEKQSVNILSEPKVFTADNQEAEFFDGQDVLVPTSSQTANTGSVTQTFDYRAVGIQLKARPRITVQGDVDLRVNLQVSSISPEETTNGGFIFDRRQTTTQLIVKDRQTVVISGILRKQDTNILRKVPLLGDIPILGWAFRSRDKSEVTSELLVFITPVVVNNTTSESMNPVNDPFRQRLDELRKSMKAPDSQRVPTAPSPEQNAAPAENPEGPAS